MLEATLAVLLPFEDCFAVNRSTLVLSFVFSISKLASCVFRSLFSLDNEEV